ncbi:CorA family divalent cation transporter [Streptomyces sp900105755]|uniref:magnesium transporter CorA family protein n=1 Tax=unclassified Streptomyces TaxID=2593676 RepID=UPI00089A8909|nr:CorA family divalent cation transporter [Streptomyces sp. Ag109_O5-10]SEE78360.1 magnesium transporter [Streptomyces sp. Ag109_O5-10]
MIVTVVSVPDGGTTTVSVPEARRRLATDRFLLLGVELPEEDEGPAQGPAEEPVVRQLGLDDEDLEWFGRPGGSPRAEFLGDTAGFVVPVVRDGQVHHVHALASETFLVVVHWGRRAGLAGDIRALVRRERPRDAVAALFLLLQEALSTFRRAAVQALLQVEELEDDMFEARRPEQIYRLSQLRRHSAVLHHTLLPYLQGVDEVITRRMLSPDFPVERQRLAQEFQRAARLVLADIESLQDASRRAFASYGSLVAGEQNGVINRLAIVSVIFLPLSFLTGFFGMNFEFLTNRLETRDEFWLLAVGLQLVAVVGSLFLLHRSRIWRRLRDDD